MQEELFKELNGTAFALAHGKKEAVKKLTYTNRFDTRAYILQMACLYKLHESGALTLEQAQEIKAKVIKEYRSIISDLRFCRDEYMQWLESTHIFEREYYNLVRAIKENDPQTLEIALDLIDLLSKHYIYKKIYCSRRKMTEEDIKRMIAEYSEKVKEIDATEIEKDFWRLINQLNCYGDPNPPKLFEALYDERLGSLTGENISDIDIPDSKETA